MTTRWLRRDAIGLAPPNTAHLAVRHDRVLGVTVHWTAGNSHDAPAQWRAIQADEMHRGYGDIAYNAGVADDGSLLEGRANGWVGAHALSGHELANRTTFGVAYIGNGNPTPAAITALKAYLFVVALELKLSAPILLLGHQDWLPFGGIPTACPGTLEPIVRQIRAAIHASAHP